MGKSRSKAKASKSKKSRKSTKVTWSNDEIGVLQSYEEKWFALSSPEEKQKLAYSSIANDLRNLSPERYGVEVMLQKRELQAEWDKKCGQIKSWYKRKAPSAKERRIFRFERRIALRTVVGQVKSVALKDAVMKKLPEDKKEDRQAYFSLYQATLTEFMRTLSKKEKKKLEDVREEWQAEGPPEEVQIKNSQRYGYRCIEEMHKVANKQFGMLLITFSARRTKHGKWEYFSHDYNPSLNGSGDPILPITSWAKAESRMFGKQFAKWVSYTDDAKAGQADSESGQSSGTRQGTVFKLQTTESGLPLLPEPILSASGEEFYGTKREILREFFVSHYRLATGKTGARVPWLAMSQDVTKFISSDYIPSTVNLNDPGRMDKSHIAMLLEHLRDRQKTEGISTFLFHHHKRHDDSLSRVEYPSDVLLDNKKAFEGNDADYVSRQDDEANRQATDASQSTGTDCEKSAQSEEITSPLRSKGKQRESPIMQESDITQDVNQSDLPMTLSDSAGPSSLGGPDSNHPSLEDSKNRPQSGFMNRSSHLDSSNLSGTPDNQCYADGTTLRLDGDPFPGTSNNAIPGSNHGSRSQTMADKETTYVQAESTGAQINEKSVRFMENPHYPAMYGNSPATGSMPQYWPGMPFGPSSSQNKVLQSQQFIPANFPGLPYFPAFYPHFSGHNAQFAPSFGPSQPEYFGQPVNPDFLKSTNHSIIDGQTAPDSARFSSNGSGVADNDQTQSKEEKSQGKRKRSASIISKESVSEQMNKAPRVTRSQTGVLGSGKRKQEPFSSGPKKKLNERWDWIVETPVGQNQGSEDGYEYTSM